VGCIRMLMVGSMGCGAALPHFRLVYISVGKHLTHIACSQLTEWKPEFDEEDSSHFVERRDEPSATSAA
jgi:hypothetical protein